ncbi:MAG: guanylate kinase [Gaiellaceae bacterium]
MPNQPVQDRGRSLGAPARRARRSPAPLKLFVVTGPSGAGKGTLIQRLLERRPDLELAVSATTRKRREGEVDGRDYHFLTEEEFVERIAADEFLEHVVYVSGRYGTLRSEIERIVEEGKHPVLELETKGARAVRDAVPGAVTIFITVPSFDELERRLRARATETSGVIEERLEVARRQLEEAGDFDHVIVNDDLDRAVDELERVIDEMVSTSHPQAGPPQTPGTLRQ